MPVRAALERPAPASVCGLKRLILRKAMIQDKTLKTKSYGRPEEATVESDFAQGRATTLAGDWMGHSFNRKT